MKQNEDASVPTEHLTTQQLISEWCVGCKKELAPEETTSVFPPLCVTCSSTNTIFVLHTYPDGAMMMSRHGPPVYERNHRMTATWIYGCQACHQGFVEVIRSKARGGSYYIPCKDCQEEHYRRMLRICHEQYYDLMLVPFGTKRYLLRKWGTVAGERFVLHFPHHEKISSLVFASKESALRWVKKNDPTVTVRVLEEGAP